MGLRVRLVYLTIASIVAGTIVACSSRPPSQESAPAPQAQGPRIYVTNEASGNLTVIDALSLTWLTNVKLGKRPRGIRLSPDKTTLYIALSGSPIAGPGVDESTLPPPDRQADGIGVVDVRSNRLLKVLKSGPDPEQLAVSADGTRLFVANEDAARATVIDIARGTIVKEVPIGEEPEGVTVRPDGREVFVTSEQDNAVFAIDTTTLSVAGRIEVGARPRSIACLPNGSRGFVTLENDGAVAVVDPVQHQLVDTIKLTGLGATPRPRPMGAAVAPDGSLVFITSGSFGHLFFLDPATLHQLMSIDVGTRPWGVAVTADGRTVYTANGPSNDISVIDVATRQVTKRVKVGDKPWGVAIVEP